MARAEEEQLRGEIRDERARLAEAVETLRAELGEAADLASRLRENLPLAAAGALAVGFVVTGGIGATMRLLMRRGREAKPILELGPFRVIERR
jgi:hypothetical protein